MVAAHPAQRAAQPVEGQSSDNERQPEAERVSEGKHGAAQRSALVQGQREHDR